MRPGWLFGRGACWWLFGYPWWYTSYWPRFGLPMPYYGFPTYFAYPPYYPWLWWPYYYRPW